MRNRLSRKPLLIVGIVWALVILSCTRSLQSDQSWRAASSGKSAPAAGTPVKHKPGDPVLTPTPDAPRKLPTPRTDPVEYVVRSNDTLGQIAQRFGISVGQLVTANSLADPDHLEVGQRLNIPLPNPLPTGPSFKIIPDSELVYGPASTSFDLKGYIKSTDSYLSRYSEQITGRTYSGAEVVQRVAEENSVNPRLLLAVLEYRGHWITQANPSDDAKTYPILANSARQGLYRQLSFAANNLDRYYYLWRVNGVASWILDDGSVIPIDPRINAGTAGVQGFFSLLLGYDDWQKVAGSSGLFKTYEQLFGYPFDLAVEPLLPPNLKQPPMQLPFEKGDQWSFTGGPHEGWADGSAWAALDFAPPGEALGCVQSNAWEVAVADGLIIRADLGAVVLDLDGDGFEQTGWTVLYMHVESRDRIKAGTYVHAGDRIGHPSCEGGVSTGTHLHLARRYNGEWIPADGSLPFNLDGWISKGDGTEYNGFLVKDGVTVEAWEGRRTENQISR